MASAKPMQQFLYSFQHMLTSVHGVINLAAEAKASLVNQGLTYTAVSFGTAGNAISIALVAGGTAGSEAVTVVGNAISVAIQDGTSTADQVKTAVNANVDSSALVLVSGSGITGITLLSATHLAGGIDGVSSYSIPGATSVTQTGVGIFEVDLDDLFNAFVFGKAMLVKSSAQDLIPQVKSQTVGTTKKVVIELLTGATPTDPGAACQLYVMFWMRNTGVSS